MALAPLACQSTSFRDDDKERAAETDAAQASVDGDCSARWEVFSSKPYEETAFPDTGANYWRIRFKAARSKPIYLRISGQYPQSRYMNFNVYDQLTQNSSASLPDVNIEPDAGSANPFRPGVPREATQRSYTAWLAVGGPSPAGPNVLTISSTDADESGDESLLELWYRVYVPDDQSSATGGAPLPRVEAFADPGAQTKVACPERATYDPGFFGAVGSLPPENPIAKIFMFRSRATGLYSNQDNVYLATRPRKFGGKVALVRFKPPTSPGGASGVAPESADVRYWSLCIGGLDQRTSGCLYDSQFKKSPKGYVTLVIGPEEVRAKAEARGQNFLPWGKQDFQILIYRNLLTRAGFAGDLRKVEGVPPGTLFDPSFAAQNFIGDHAPVGRQCLKAVYETSNCDVAQD